MKNNLEYQKTEYDCGAQAYINALSSLFEREEIPPDFIKNIYQYTLDEYGKEAFHGGTSPNAMRFIVEWMNAYADIKEFPIKCVHMKNYDISKDSFLYRWIAEGGVAILRVHFNNFAHYILVTSVDCEKAYIFDSYIDTNVDSTCNYNATAFLENMNNNKYANYYIGDADFKNAFLIKRTH